MAWGKAALPTAVPTCIVHCPRVVVHMPTCGAHAYLHMPSCKAHAYLHMPSCRAHAGQNAPGRASQTVLAPVAVSFFQKSWVSRITRMVYSLSRAFSSSANWVEGEREK